MAPWGPWGWWAGAQRAGPCCVPLAPPWDRPPGTTVAWEHGQPSLFPTPGSLQKAQRSAFFLKAQLIRSIFYFLRGGSCGIKIGSVNSGGGWIIVLPFINFFTVKFLWFSKITWRKTKAHLSHYCPRLFTAEFKRPRLCRNSLQGLSVSTDNPGPCASWGTWCTSLGPVWTEASGQHREPQVFPLTCCRCLMSAHGMNEWIDWFY